jgi:hypothetical protein
MRRKEAVAMETKDVSEINDEIKPSACHMASADLLIPCHSD